MTAARTPCGLRRRAELPRAIGGQRWSIMGTNAELGGDIWYWYHNISEPYYHIQLTIKYRKSLLNKKTEKVLLEATKEFKERYAIEISHVEFDKNQVHFLCKFLPKYSGGQVIKVI